jgi:hypothetical protein
MFYEAVELENILICMICENKFQDPRLLPCGRTFCNSCIDFMVDTEKKKVKCQYCSKTHEIPQDGFMPNLDMARIVKLKSNEVFRCKLDRELRTKSNLLRNKVDKIKNDLTVGESLIRDHCDKVRNDVQLAVEQAHVKLDEIHGELMDEINAYEKRVQENLKNTKNCKTKFEEQLNDSEQFLEKSMNLLKKFQTEEYELRKSIKDTDLLLRSIEKLHDEIKTDLFEGINLKFVSNMLGLQSSSLGCIRKLNINLHFLENNNFKSLNLQPKLTKLDSSSKHIYIRPFRYNALLCLYKSKSDSNIWNFSCFTKEGDILLQKNNALRTKCVQNPPRTPVQCQLETNSFNNVFVWFYDNGEEYIYSFDEDLNQISHIVWDQKDLVELVACNYRNVFFLSCGKDHSSIREYNQELELVKQYGQRKKNAPFYFSPAIQALLVTDQFFIISEVNNESVNDDDDSDDEDETLSVVFVNKTSGIVEKKWRMRGDWDDMKWSFYMDNFIVIHHSSTGRIRCYNFDGVLVSQSRLPIRYKSYNVKELTNFQCVSNKELHFLNEENSKLLSI